MEGWDDGDANERQKKGWKERRQDTAQRSKTGKGKKDTEKIQ